ncbi:MAG: lytic transglycosylase domain-containing protein [bacterium]
MKLKKFKFSLMVGYLVIIFSIIIHQKMLDKKITNETLKLQQQVEQMDSFIKIDKLHKENINKVLLVLNRYNDSMPFAQKYAIASEISMATMKYDNLDVDLICATITHESAFTWDSKIVSPAGALGLMQVMPATGQFLAKIEGLKWTTPEEILFDPVLNIRLGSRYLSSLIELYDVDGGLAAYNGGGKRVEMWLAQNRAHGILYEETQNYVPAVLSLYQEFRN